MVMFKILDKTSQNHFCPFQGFEIFLQEIFSKKSKENPASHKCILWSPCKASSQLKSFWFTKMPQNPLWPESNLNNFVLPAFSPWPQLLWACSHDQMRPLHQVVHQGEVLCSTRSTQVHFCSFLGFTKVALATFSKWTQTWWSTSIMCDTWSC